MDDYWFWFSVVTVLCLASVTKAYFRMKSGHMIMQEIERIQQRLERLEQRQSQPQIPS